MKPYIKQVLELNFNPKDFDTFRAFMAEYYDKVLGIISDFSKGDDRTFLTVQAGIWKALAPRDRMVFGIMDLMVAIGWEGLMGGLFTSDGQRIRNIQEAINISGSVFLKEKFEEGLRLYKTKHGFIDPNTFSGIVEMIKHNLSLRRPTNDTELVGKVDAIGEEIDNWDYEDVEKMYYQLAGK